MLKRLKYLANLQTDSAGLYESGQQMQQTPAAAISFVMTFREHHRRCARLAKRFATINPNLADSAALSAFCRASQEMADQAKAARTLTEIYLSLDEKHRDSVRAIIVGRFKDILASAENSWRRFCDSMLFVCPTAHEIQLARSDFEAHADEFKHALSKFVTIAEGTAELMQ